MPESVEKVFYEFIQLSEEDRRWVLVRMANDEDGEPVDMFVSAAAVLSADEFEEAEKKLRERGYVPLANPTKAE
jgi:hypothetical protein